MDDEGEPPPVQKEEPPFPEEEEEHRPADEDFYEKVTVETKPAYRFQFVVQPFDFNR